jgi:hypothetical protein
MGTALVETAGRSWKLVTVLAALTASRPMTKTTTMDSRPAT